MTQNQSQSRNRGVDIAKGAGIVLVVLGHALKQTGGESALLRIPLFVIYSFHMPLFFFLSGMVSARIFRLRTDAGRGWRDVFSYIGGRFLRLMVPYIVWSLLYIPLKLYFADMAIKPYAVSDIWRILIGDSPNTQVWFLYILFVCSAVAALTVTQDTLYMVLAASFLFSACAYQLEWQIAAPRYFFYFCLGLTFRRLADTNPVPGTATRGEAVRNVILSWQSAAVAAVLFVFSNLCGWQFGKLWLMLAGVTGIMLVIFFSTLADEKLPKLEGRLGRRSMDIYLFSDPVMTVVRMVTAGMLQAPGAVTILLCFAAGLLIPLPLCSLIIRRVKLFRVLLLGER